MSEEWLERSQCTFWCSVLSDDERASDADVDGGVSMHLLVLSAFRHQILSRDADEAGLNAPFGAQCFPTSRHRGRKQLNRPASQCTFWCSVLSDLRMND